jgi:hypothetical protein
VLEATLGWPPSDGADVTMPGGDSGVAGVWLFLCTMGSVPVEFMGGYGPETNSGNSG